MNLRKNESDGFFIQLKIFQVSAAELLQKKSSQGGKLFSGYEGNNQSFLLAEKRGISAGECESFKQKVLSVTTHRTKLLKRRITQESIKK